MFRKMRRNPKQILSEEQCICILENSSSGVMSVLGDDEYPYGVPLSFVYKDGKLFFHGMGKGHKIDAIRNHNKACFTVIEKDQVVPEEYTTYFRSVILFGEVRIIEDMEEKRQTLMDLVEKYSPNFIEESHKEVESSLKAVCIFTLEIDHMSGKEAIELAKQD
jgi:nitroimidazol reductase NimA-like FMN-containing flavoprotein (pyridoxamine 5'-phosphate oxidase superfamily)